MTISEPPITSPPEPKMRVTTLALGLILVAFGISFCFGDNPAADLFWQIRTGHDIAISRSAPTADAYSWTRHGHLWVVHEWLCFLLFWETYHAGGFSALWLLEGCLVASVVMLVYRQILTETRAPITAFLLTAMCAALASDFFQPRPHLFTYLCIALTLIALQRMRQNALAPKRLWLLVPMFALWSNLHAGVILGVAILAAFSMGDVVDARRDAAERGRLLSRARFTALLALACALVTVVNPYGARIYEDLWSTLSNSTAMNTVLEWSSPNFHQDNGKTLELFFILIAYALAFTGRKRETGPLIVLSLLVYGSLSAIRNFPLLAIAGALLIAKDLQSSLERHVPKPTGAREYLFGRFPSAVAVIAVGVTFAFVASARIAASFRADGRAGVAILPRIASNSFGFDYFPSAACRFIETQRFPASMTMYNIYDAGGYLIWRLPERPVFVDGRADVYFGQVLEDSNKVQKMSYDWADVLNHYHCDLVLTFAAKKQTRLFLNSSDWVLVYADRSDLDVENDHTNSLIFVRNLPKYASLIARCRADCPAAILASKPRTEVF